MSFFFITHSPHRSLPHPFRHCHHRLHLHLASRGARTELGKGGIELHSSHQWPGGCPWIPHPTSAGFQAAPPPPRNRKPHRYPYWASDTPSRPPTPPCPFHRPAHATPT